MSRAEHAEASRYVSNIEYYKATLAIPPSEVQRLKRQRERTLRQQGQREDTVQALEEQLEVNVRWTPSDDEYQSILEESGIHKYRKALDKLERLVVQRLLELTKLGMSGIGLHVHLAFALD